MPDLRFEGMVNIRDVGGAETTDGGTVRSGILLRSETPQLMSPGDVKRATAELGVTRVIDLRGRRAEGSGPIGRDGRGVVIDFFGLTGGHGLSFDTSADGFLPGQLDRAGAVVGLVLDQLTAAEGTTLVHCHTGKDRTGFVVAVILAVLGVGDEAIVADYMASSPVYGTMIANLERAGLAIPPSAPAYARHAPSPKGIRAMLAQLRSGWPSPAHYLIDSGVDPSLIERTRATFRG